MPNLSSRVASIVVIVEDPGAMNFLVPLVDTLIEREVSLILFGFGVGGRQLSERGYPVIPAPSTDNAQNVLQACRCSLLIAGTCENKNTPTFGLIRAARLSGIKTVGAVDALVNAQFRFRGCSDDPLAHAPDWMMVPDEATADAFVCLGYPRGRISVVGHAGRDLARRRAQSLRLRMGEGSHTRSQDEYLIVFISELSDGLNKGQYTCTCDYTLMGRGGSSARTAIVAEELLDACSALQTNHGINFKLVLRLHPKQDKSDLGRLNDEFDEVSIGGDPLEVITTANLVVGMTSMLLIHAYDIGLSCLSVLPREEEKAWLPEIASGAIPSVLDRASLRDKLYSLLLTRAEARIDDKSENSTSDALDSMINFLDSICADDPIKGRG